MDSCYYGLQMVVVKVPVNKIIDRAVTQPLCEASLQK